jgi:phenylalanyl-tRNA synthetase beta subunit
MMLDVDNKTINNRPDLTGLLGMAIEMRAIFRANNTPEIIKHENITHVLEEHSPIRTLELLSHATPCTQQISLQTDKCSVYSLLHLTNLSVRKSPFYDRLSLIDSGLSSKNNWVDFSNLFMTISGQPIHCFDADKIKGTITIREAKDGEKFTDLTGIEHSLIVQDIVIADDSGVIALAGVI